MINLLDVSLIFIILLVIWGFYHITVLREKSYKAAIQYCQQQDLQLLDENVAIKRLWFKRDKAKNFHFWLMLEFEFSSTGEERYKGQVVVLGNKVTNIITPPYRMPTSEETNEREP